MSAIKDMVENPNWIHKRYCTFWDFLLQSYEGGMDYCNGRVIHNGQSSGLYDPLFKYFVNGREQQLTTISGNLFNHPKERTEDYNRRIQMSYYYNFCAPIIDIYSDHLFRQEVVEDWEEIEDTISTIGEDIDNQGSSIVEFRKQLAESCQIYGHSYVLVDSPILSGTDIITRKDQIENRAFPYATIYSPQNIINWALDKFGNPYWVLIRETDESNDNPLLFDKNKVLNVYYRLWTRDSWVLYNEKYEQIAEGVHGLGYVPIVCCFDKKSKLARNFLGVSSIADISFISRDVYNACSELRQILRDQTFAFLALQGSSDEYSEVALGTGKGLVYPPERNAPQYVSPPADNARLYYEHIDRQVTKIFQMAKLEGGSGQQNQQSADIKSGVAKAWDFNQTNASLASKALNLEDAERKIWMIFANWEGKQWTGSIQYPSEFSTSDLSTDLDEAEKLAKQELGNTFNIEVKKALIKKKFPRKPDEEVEEMVQEAEQKMNVKSVGESLRDRMSNLIKTNTATGGKKQGEKDENSDLND